MSIPPQPNIRLTILPDYRDGYANSIQVRVSVWDFLLIFGRLQPPAGDRVGGSPKFSGDLFESSAGEGAPFYIATERRAVRNAFGEIKLDAVPQPHGQVH